MDNNPLAQVVPDIALDVTVDSKAIVSIAVSNHEEALRDAKKKLDDQINELGTSIEGLKKGFEKVVLSMAQDWFREKEKELLSVLHSLGKGATTKIECSTEKRSDCVLVNFYLDLSIERANYNSRDVRFSHTEEHEEGTELWDYQEKIEEEKEERSVLMRNSLDINTRLQNLDAITRKAEADMARLTLSKSESGREILAKMDNVSPNFIKIK